MLPNQLPLELPEPKDNFAPCLGYRQVSGGLYEKCMDTGAVRERLDYEHFSEYPDDLSGPAW